MRKLASLFVIVFFVCFSYASMAQENPYALETKVIQNQQQLKLLQQQQAQLYLKIDSLLVKYGEIKGELDDIRHRLDAIQNQINEILLRNTSIPQPIAPNNPRSKAALVEKQPNSQVGNQTISKKIVKPTHIQNQITTAQPKKPKPSVPKDEISFDKALSLFKSKRYNDAILAFKEFKNRYKTSRFIPDSIFYIAESYYAKGEYDKAIINYDYLVNTYQTSNKVPMATYKEGLAFIKMGDRIDGNYLLQKVLKQYPNSEAAKLARKYLKKG